MASKVESSRTRVPILPEAVVCVARLRGTIPNWDDLRAVLFVDERPHAAARRVCATGGRREGLSILGAKKHAAFPSYASRTRDQPREEAVPRRKLYQANVSQPPAQESASANTRSRRSVGVPLRWHGGTGSGRNGWLRRGVPRP